MTTERDDRPPADRDALMKRLHRAPLPAHMLDEVAAELYRLAREWNSSDLVDAAMWLDGTL